MIGDVFLKVNGTLINYYFHCKRQCWLHGNRVNMESNSEDVKIGKAIHKVEQEKSKNTELTIDNIKVDKITDEYLVEIKKSDSDIEAVKWQVLFYLKVLKSKGINKKGKIIFKENKKVDKKTFYVELNTNTEKELMIVIDKIENLLNEEMPPKIDIQRKCKKCAYYEFCFI